jgi:hypothetical protein
MEKNIPVHTLIAIDTMHAAYGYIMYCIWRGSFLMPANCTSTLVSTL